ncbi:hypothetical protein OROGR_008705 [Orobanche gracilis]
MATIVAAGVDRNAAMAAEAPLAPVTLERPVRTDLETSIPKPFEPWSYAPRDYDVAIKIDIEENNINEDEDSEKDSENDPDDVLSDGGIPSRENFPSDKEVMNDQIPEAKNQSFGGLISRSYGQDRIRYPYSMLSPVENLVQWKIVKAKAETVQMNLNPKQEKESFLGRWPNSDSLIPNTFLDFQRLQLLLMLVFRTGTQGRSELCFNKEVYQTRKTWDKDVQTTETDEDTVLNDLIDRTFHQVHKSPSRR